VRYFPGAFQKDNVEHYKIVLDRLPTFDYYLYMGFDEGSMGFLDALAAGIPTIVTRQGFHLDISGGITHAFSNASELGEIFQKLSRERQHRINSVAHLTWNEYARKHALVWRALISGRSGEISALLHAKDVGTTPLPKLPSDAFGFSRFGNFTSFKADFSLLWKFYTGTKFEKTPFFRIGKFIKCSLIKKRH
jgi:hypothetical protein